MTSNNKIARAAGFIYLLVVVFGVFALMVVRPNIIVPGDAAATADQIMASEPLFRAGIVSELVMYFCFLLLPLPLYVLLKSVHKNAALLMVLLVFISVPIAMLNTLNNFAALSLLSGGGYLAAFSVEQLQAQMMFFLDLYEDGYLIAQIFFGAWLLPLGYLVYQSGYFPRVLGVLLVLGGLSQLTGSFVGFLFPDTESMIISALEIFGFSEILFAFWLLIRGVKEQPQHSFALEPARN
jgi:hypothetical protein